MDIDINSIKHMEEMSLNAWPSHKSELYDGWIIRYSHNYTYRTNCVEQIGASVIPLEEKIAFCENAYRHHGTPATFKINPITDPAFDAMLAGRGYEIRHVTDVMTTELDTAGPVQAAAEEYDFENSQGMPSCMRYRINGNDIAVVMRHRITDEWISGVFHLNGTSDPQLRRIVPAMFKAIPKKTIVCSIESEGRMVASGLGICDRDYIGLYAIYVSPSCRRRGYARAVCSSLLTEGGRQGADRAYLQVVQSNSAAKGLYEDLGFGHFYTYHFRSKDVINNGTITEEIK